MSTSSSSHTTAQSPAPTPSHVFAPGNKQKCLVYGPNNTVLSKHKPITTSSTLPKHHLLVKVHSVGLNPVDAKQLIGDKLPSVFQFLASRIVRGCTIGLEFSGVVVQGTPSTTRTPASHRHITDTNTNNNHDDDRDDDTTYTTVYKVGDRVFGSMPPMSGTLSDYIVVPLDQVAHMPSSLAFPEAASLVLVGLTALQALRPEYESIVSSSSWSSSSTTRKPASICIVGASGGTGHVALQISKLLGFTTIVAVCSTRNIDFCQQHGATHVIDYTNDHVVEDLKDILRKSTTTAAADDDDEKVDVIMDCVTSVDACDRIHEYPTKLLPLCRKRYIRLGGPTRDWFVAGSERMMNNLCGGKRRGIQWFGKEKLFWIRFPNSHNDLVRLKRWCDQQEQHEDGTMAALKPTVTRQVEFTPEAVQSAMEGIMSRRIQGKCVVNLIQ